MIVHEMLIDKKLETTLWAIDLLKHIRGYASVLVLACVAVYLWNTCRFRLSNAERVAQQEHLRSRWDRSLRKPDRSCASPFGCAQRGNIARAQLRACKSAT